MDADPTQFQDLSWQKGGSAVQILVVQPRTVAAVEVADDHVVALEAQFQVTSRNAVVVQDEPAARITSDNGEFVDEIQRGDAVFILDVDPSRHCACSLAS